MRAAGIAIASLLLCFGVARADTTAGHAGQMGAHMHSGPHMRFTDPRPVSGKSEARARELLAVLRQATAKYRDAEQAIAAGFQPFLPTVPQEVYHFVHYPQTTAEYDPDGSFDATRPGSLLYRRRLGRYELVGAMYSAAPSLSPDDLDRRIPLAIARWHAHVNVCLPEGITLEDLTRGEIGSGHPHLAGTIPGGGSRSGVSRNLNRRFGFMADGRFGFEGKIADRQTCEAAGGGFLPQAWGWMVHVYPFAGDDLAVAFGMDVP